MKKYFLLLFIFSSQFVYSQERPFWKEIQAYKKQDSLNFPARKSILFVGSSSFAFWKSLSQDFPQRRVINRGFGGSGLPHVIQYADDIIFPYEPKQIIIYCGENDFYQGEGVTPEMVAARFEQLFKKIRKELPRTHIAFVSLKPSPRRQALMPEMLKTNALIKDYLDKQKRASYINIYDVMLDAQGNPRKELFTEDNLHMNENGYAIWKRSIEPHLKKTGKPRMTSA